MIKKLLTFGKTMKEQSAPRCVQCNSECPNGLIEYPLLIVCQNPRCPNYWVFQAGSYVMEELDKQFPIWTIEQ